MWYRSLSDADRKEWSFYGLIAEEVAEVDPRLVSYLKTPDGLVPDGVQYDRLGVLMLDVLKRQKSKLGQLAERVELLEELKAL